MRPAHLGKDVAHLVAGLGVAGAQHLQQPQHLRGDGCSLRELPPDVLEQLLDRLVDVFRDVYQGPRHEMTELPGHASYLL